MAELEPAGAGGWLLQARRGAAIHPQLEQAAEWLRQDRLPQARAALESTLAQVPGSARALHLMGVLALREGRPHEALDRLRAVLSQRPGDPAVLNDLGCALRRLGRTADALDAFGQGLARAPDTAELHVNQGHAWMDLNRLDEALACYDRALALEPDCASAHYRKGSIELLRGDFAAGWRSLWRAYPQVPGARWYRGFTQPLWLGEQPLAGRTVLLHAEQGLGDALQFSRFAPQVAALGAEVVLEVFRPLAGLLGQLPGVRRVVARGDPLPAFDLHCPLHALPIALGLRLQTIPAADAWLRPEPLQVAAWGERLGPRRGPRVGLVCSGDPHHPDDPQRSLPLARLLAALPPGVEAVCLQPQLRPADRAALAGDARLRWFGPELRDFGDTAALCAHLDLVVSVDTSVAHLAASLGRPTWILLPFAPDYRWMLGREDSPWYPSVKLYRQAASREWDGLLARLAGDLLDWARTAREPGGA